MNRSPKKPQSNSKTRQQQLMLVLAANILLFGTLYYLIPRLGFYYLPFIYIGVGAVLALWYVIYNKGFRTLHKTADMLPEEFSLEEREFLIADGKRRMEASRWALLIVIPLLAIFLVDYIYLSLPEAWFS